MVCDMPDIYWEWLPWINQQHISRLHSEGCRSSDDDSQGRRGNQDLTECSIASAGFSCDNATDRLSASHREPEVLWLVFLISSWSQQRCWACPYFCSVFPFHFGMSFSALFPFGWTHPAIRCRGDWPCGAQELCRAGPCWAGMGAGVWGLWLITDLARGRWLLVQAVSEMVLSFVRSAQAVAEQSDSCA